MHNLGVTVESHKNKQLHITLAYKFPSSQLKQLEKLAKRLDLNKSSSWEVRLYSKDPRYMNCETLRVLYPYAPTSDGHLQLINGDYVFVGPDDVSDKYDQFVLMFVQLGKLQSCSISVNLLLENKKCDKISLKFVQFLFKRFIFLMYKLQLPRLAIRI